MDLLQLKAVAKKDEKGFHLRNIDFTQRANQNIAIAGETGSGKTTLLKIIAGLAQPDEGEVIFLNEKVIGPADKLIPGHKGIVYLPQDFRLPHFLRVEQILEYANEWPVEKAEQLFELCRIRHLFKRRTDELSGGEQQRIAIARLLVMDPKLFLLDEPFSNMDPANKSLLKTIIRDISKELNMSFIMTSHDPNDSLPWADEIIVMKEGLIMEKNCAFEIYTNPAFAYTASLFGAYNVIPDDMISSTRQQASVRGELLQAIARPENCRIIGLNQQSGSREGGHDSPVDAVAAQPPVTNDSLLSSGADNGDPYLQFGGRVSEIRYYGHYYETEVITHDTIFICTSSRAAYRKDDQIIIRIFTKDIRLVRS